MASYDHVSLCLKACPSLVLQKRIASLKIEVTRIKCFGFSVYFVGYTYKVQLHTVHIINVWIGSDIAVNLINPCGDAT